LRAAINFGDRCFGLRALMRDEQHKLHALAGDRAIEWSWIVSHLPKCPGRILDLGCVESALTGMAWRLGHCVTSVDLREIEYEMPGVTFIRCDINDLSFEPGAFDAIMNCSMIEHVGLPDRYGSTQCADGDLLAMRRLAVWLKDKGTMLLTIPVGRDGVFAPYHRVYGQQRLPALLEGYRVLEEEYWHKDDASKWVRCEKDAALETQGRSDSYALGLFVLGGWA
jgi:SAM-dependent methyltransferase